MQHKHDKGKKKLQRIFDEHIKYYKMEQLTLFPISAPQACNQTAVIAVVPYDENSPAVAPPSPDGNESLYAEQKHRDELSHQEWKEFLYETIKEQYEQPN